MTDRVDGNALSKFGWSEWESLFDEDEDENENIQKSNLFLNTFKVNSYGNRS